MVISIIEYFLQSVNAIIEYFRQSTEVIFTIYRIIKEICQKKGMSIRSVERQAGLGNGTISGWSKCSPTLEKIRAVADILGCTVDDLITDRPEEQEVV